MAYDMRAYDDGYSDGYNAGLDQGGGRIPLTLTLLVLSMCIGFGVLIGWAVWG